MQHAVNKGLDAVGMTTLNSFPEYSDCSCDKGDWSPENKLALDKLSDHLVLPKKGRLSVDDKQRKRKKPKEQRF